MSVSRGKALRSSVVGSLFDAFAKEASVVSADHAQATQAAVVAALNAAAERIESLTRQLNQTVVDAVVPMG